MTQSSKNIGLKMKVMGVGSGALRILTRLYEEGALDVDFCIVNTNKQNLENSAIPEKIQIGKSMTDNLGTSGDLELAKKAFDADTDLIKQTLKGLDILFLVGCLGGGTASAGIFQISKLARAKGIMTIMIVTKPFVFEGSRKIKIANEALEKSKKQSDSLMILPNDTLMRMADEKTTMMDGFKLVDFHVGQVIKAITRLLIHPGLIPVDFQDIRTVLSIAGEGRIGFGFAEGKGKIIRAFDQALECPLLGQNGLSNAPGVLIAIHGSKDLNLLDVYHAVRKVTQITHSDAHIVFGATVDSGMNDRVEVCLMGSGLSPEDQRKTVIKGVNVREEQSILDLHLVDKGCFAKDEPTVYNGIDLDIPTFLRKKIKNH